MFGGLRRNRSLALAGGVALALLTLFSAARAERSPFAVRTVAALETGNLSISYGRPPQLVAGQPLTLTVVVRNTASATAAVPKDLVLVRAPMPAKAEYLRSPAPPGYACKPAHASSTAPVECRALVNDSIPAGASRTFTLVLNTYPQGGPIAIGERFTSQAEVDPNRVIVESTELDNTTTVTLPVTAPALVVRYDCTPQLNKYEEGPAAKSDWGYLHAGTHVSCIIWVTNRPDATAPAIFPANAMLLANSAAPWEGVSFTVTPFGVSCTASNVVPECRNTGGTTITIPIGGALRFQWEGTLPRTSGYQFMTRWVVSEARIGLIQLDPKGLSPSSLGESGAIQFGGWVEPG